jgi:hypothetical protein
VHEYEASAIMILGVVKYDSIRKTK